VSAVEIAPVTTTLDFTLGFRETTACARIDLDGFVALQLAL
jgi:hypothetical protein